MKAFYCTLSVALEIKVNLNYHKNPSQVIELKYTPSRYQSLEHSGMVFNVKAF